MITVGVTFQNSTKEYTYMTNDTSIKVDDMAVVKSNSGQFSIVKVRKVHPTPQLGDGHNYTWLVQKIDTAEYDANVQADHQGYPKIGDRL